MNDTSSSLPSICLINKKENTNAEKWRKNIKILTFFDGHNKSFVNMQKCTNRSAPLEKALHLKENVMPKPDLLESKCILSQMYDYHETKCRTLNNFF